MQWCTEKFSSSPHPHLAEGKACVCNRGPALVTEVGRRGCAWMPSVCSNIGVEEKSLAHPDRSTNDLKTLES